MFYESICQLLGTQYIGNIGADRRNCEAIICGILDELSTLRAELAAAKNAMVPYAETVRPYEAEIAALRSRAKAAENELSAAHQSKEALTQACDRHHEAYKVAERERVALVKRSHNQRVEIGRLIEQLTAATARAEAAEKEALDYIDYRNQAVIIRNAMERRLQAAESLVAGLRGALEEVNEALCGITGLGNMAKQVAVAYTAINAALALTPASAGARLKAEALREAKEAANGK